jgi:hypothetical protein
VLSVRKALGGRQVLAAAAVLAGLGLLGATDASAEVFKVSTTAELSAAVGKANASPGANTIVVASGVYLPTKALIFTNKTGLQTVEGPSGPPNVKLEAAKLEGSAVEPAESELIVIKEATVSVEFKDIVLTHGGGGSQSAIEDFGSLDLEASTVSGNIGNAVAVQPGASAIVRNSTLSDGSSGGLVVSSGTATFENSTVAFNKGAGIENKGSLSLKNTIVAENAGGDCEGSPTTTDHSLDTDGTCGVGALSETNPLLQTSAANDGGSTVLHSLKPKSPAIGAGDSATCTATDQRGATRAKPCSIGADEYNATPPTIKVPADITTPATETSGSSVTYAAEATSPDAVVRTFSCTPESGSTFPLGTTTVSCAAKDGHENTAAATFKVTVTEAPAEDKTPPVITGVPADITTEATGASGAAVTYTNPTATDNLDGTDPVTCVPPSGSTFPLGTTVVTCTATDKAGNGAMVTFNVTVTDKTPPLITGVPADISAKATGASGAVVTYTNPTATDTVDGTDTVGCVPASGSTFPLGPTTVTCTASDKAGNKATATFKVTVTEAPVEDKTPPVIAGVPADISTEATGASGAAVTYTNPTATDNVDGTDPVSCVPASGSTFPLGATVVTCTATDKAGNKATATFKVTVTEAPVEDKTPPVIAGVPADISTEATGASGAAVTYTNPTATDNLDGTDPVTCVPPSGSTFPLGETTVTCTATDKAGNEATATFMVTVTEHTTEDIPVISGVPADIKTSGPVITYTTPTATDPVDGTDPVICDPPSGSTFSLDKVTTVTCTATNKAGQSATATFTITATVIVNGVPADISTEATSPSGAVVTYTDPTAHGVDFADTVTCVPPSGSTFPLGTTIVTCTANELGTGGPTVPAGAFKVTVTPLVVKPPPPDETPPVIAGVPADITKTATGASGAAVTYTNPTATDNVDGTDPVSCVPPSGSTFPLGTTTVTCTATDKAGNGAMATFKVTVTEATVEPPAEDKTPPVITGMPADVTVAATSAAGAVVTYPNPTATDNVDGTDPVTCVPPSGSTFAVGTTTVTCTSTDKAGNGAMATFTVTVTAGEAEEAEEAPPTAVTQLQQLLRGVGASRIQRGVRFELSGLLADALRSLAHTPGLDQRWRQCTAQQRALGDLGQFISLIRLGERGRRPLIAPAIGNPWIQSAQSIEASLICRPAHHGRSGGRAHRR